MPDTPAPYCVTVETAAGVKPHGFHLGTDLNVAKGCIFDILRRDGVRTVALYKGAPGVGRPLRIFDWRDLPGNMPV